MAWTIRIMGAVLAGCSLWFMLFEAANWEDVILAGILTMVVFFASWMMAAWWEDTKEE